MIEPIIESLEFKDISDNEYFSNTYSDYISNSRLSLINPEQGGSKEKFLENVHKTSTSLSLGSAIHELTLEPDDFILAPKCGKPTAKLGLMADELYPFFKANKNVAEQEIINASNKIDYYRNKMDEKKIANVLDKCWNYWQYRTLYEVDKTKELIFLDDNSYDKCAACIKSLKENKNIQNLLCPKDAISLNEHAAFINFKYTSKGKSCILKFKAKFDNITISGDNIVLNDLKTTGHYVDQFKDSFEKFHYYRQVACYAFLLKELAKKYYNIETIDSLTCNFLLVSTIPNYKSSVFKMTYKDLERGWNEFIVLMNKVGEIYAS